MNKYKVTVYAICKNEEQFIDRWMDAVSEADEVIVLDTGSTDNTVEKLRARGAAVYVELIKPWRFDEARNRAIDKISEDTDICVSNDIDEVFEPGWRKKLEDAWEPYHTRARYTFVWSHNEDNSIKEKYSMEKIHKRHGFQWVHPVHEVLEYTGNIPDQTVDVPNIILHHYPDYNKPRSQYLPLLELSVQEHPENDRATFWLGREYMYYEQYEDSIRTLKNHLRLPKAVWKEERSASMRYISQCYDKLGDVEEAKAWLFKSIGECYTIREPYIALAKIGYREKDWALVYAIVTEALRVTRYNENYLIEAESWGYLLYDLAAIGGFYLGLYKESKNYAIAALQMDPENQRLIDNLNIIEDKLKDININL